MTIATGPTAIVTADNALGLGVFERFDTRAEAAAELDRRGGRTAGGLQPWDDRMQRIDRDHRRRLADAEARQRGRAAALMGAVMYMLAAGVGRNHAAC